MDEKAPSPSLRKPRRRWLRRIFYTLAVLFVLVAAFHRVIFFSLVKWGVGFAEKAGKMQIAYQLDGTIFTSLHLSKVKVRVLEPGPLRKLTLGDLALRYHPWDGLTKGLPALIESVELRDLDLVLDGTRPQPPPPPKKKKTGKPGIAIPFPKLVDIRGVRVRVETPTGWLDVDNANLALLPDRPGVISVDHLIIPAYRTFDNLRGTTSYRNRDLILENLTILPDLILQRLQVDASQLANDQIAARLAAQTFGGNIALDLTLANLGSTGDLKANIEVNTLDFARLAAFLGPKVQLSGVLQQLKTRIDGRLSDLATWNGSLNLQVGKPAFGKLSFDTAAINATLENGRLHFSDTALLKGEEWATLSGTAQLPGRDTKAHPLLADVAISANLPDFSTLLPDATGSASLNLLLKASPSQVDARLDSDITALALKTLNLDSAKATAHFSKTSSGQIDWKEPWWNDTNIAASLTTAALRISGYQIDHVGATLKSVNEKVNLESIEIARGQNSVRTSGTFTLLEKPAGPLPGILDLALVINGPSLQEFAVDPENPVISGEAQASGTVHWEGPQPKGSLHLQGSSLYHQGLDLGTLTLDAEADNGLARLTNLLLDMPGESFIQATGQFDLLTKDSYAGQLSVHVADLSQFKPLLGKALAEKPLTGAIQLDWNGTGQLVTRRHEGRLALNAQNGAFGDVSGIRLISQGYYTPTQAEFPIIDLSTSKGNLATAISYFNRVLKIDNLKLTQNKEIRLAGNLALPVDIEQIANSEKRFPLDAPIAIDLSGKNVQLSGLFADLGLPPPVTGGVSLDIKSKGTLRNLDALISLAVVNIQSEKAKQVGPVSGEINLAIGNQRANLSGSLRESSIQPISLSGSVPLDLASIISTGSINPRLPIQARASLPASSLAFATRYVRAIGNIDGTLGFDLGVEGTLEKPAFSGGVKANVKSVRFRNNNTPNIRDVILDLGFRENVLTFNQLKGDLAGGPFSTSGTINLTKPAEPVFDLKLQGRSILVVRNDTVIVRSDLDVGIKGPLNAAEVSGTIGITDSRFFREIDILPINLPGRPAPSVPDKRSNLSFPNPPLRDWKFNVNIKTLDPFRVTGNLANGEVVVALNFGGTGLAPTLDGNVQIAHLKASLPFSTLTIDAGNIYFSKDLPPLNPILDLRGKSRVRDYDIDAYIWGDLVKPQTLFLSQPPLTQEDILTLIATGVTQSEIAANPQLLAGRAGYLFIQKYYNKIFKRKQSFEQDSLADKLDVQIGNVDPKTGRESATARLRVSDRWQVIGDLDLTGGVRGQVRYLLRFK